MINMHVRNEHRLDDGDIKKAEKRKAHTWVMPRSLANDYNRSTDW